ncbi:MAG: molecular chaperone HtpG [Lentisphaeria bacterium]|nr:molecular chaperone HtpG [Lentisphaeria bacterium]
MGKVQTFKTEVSQLLDLMINSLYSNKDIFLRELVANAADAIDKARFESLTRPELARDWQIRLAVDKENKTLTISDNGIGMTESEVIENIGTIARSGTKAFMQEMAAREDQSTAAPDLIGQFGVGFYSAFMVAEEVTLVTKKSGSDEPAVRWISKGEGSFETDTDPRTEPGTSITLKLRQNCDTYLEEWKLSDIVHRYSDFIAYPIIFPHVKVNEDKTETIEDRTLNSQKAIWLRKPSEITEEEHKSFFAHLSNWGGSEYLQVIPIAAEGVQEFRALIYIPEQAPFNFLMPDLQKKGLQLYVHRVFITDECKELIPDYLRFVRGVVDSSDLPLNVSREILQENPLLLKIQKAVTTKVLAELQKMLDNDPEKYRKFFREFGKILKEGIHTDRANGEKLKKLALFESMNNKAGELITLDDYVKTMPESQKDIYYITGESRAAVESSPALEYYRAKGFDVLFMTDPIDEWIMQSMYQFDKKNFKSVIRGEFEADEEEKKTLDEAAEKYTKLVDFLKKSLDGDVSEVRFSGRLTDSPCCLVIEGNALSPHMERLFKAMNQEIPRTKRILELNPTHPLTEALNARCEAGEEGLDRFARVLYDQALLTEGSPIPDPAAFAKNVTELLLGHLKKD